jgi:hypothetical protein
MALDLVVEEGACRGRLAERLENGGRHVKIEIFPGLRNETLKTPASSSKATRSIVDELLMRQVRMRGQRLAAASVPFFALTRIRYAPKRIRNAWSLTIPS